MEIYGKNMTAFCFYIRKPEAAAIVAADSYHLLSKCYMQEIMLNALLALYLIEYHKQPSEVLFYIQIKDKETDLEKLNNLPTYHF